MSDILPPRPRTRRPRKALSEAAALRFSAPHLVGGEPTRALAIGDVFEIRDSARNNGTFEVLARDADWVTVDSTVHDEPPSPHATLTVIIDEEPTP